VPRLDLSGTGVRMRQESIYRPSRIENRVTSEPHEWTVRRARTLEQFARANDDPAERAKILRDIVDAHLDVAESVARRYSSAEADDLRQVAYIGLIKASERFDAAKGDDFVSFAVPTISGEIKRYLRDSSWVVRPPRPVQELRAHILASTENLTHQLGHSPTPRDIATYLKVQPAAVVEAIAAYSSLRPESLDSPVVSDEYLTLAETIGHTDDAIEKVELIAMLGAALHCLSARDRRIVHLRFYQEQTQQEIARELGVTQMQVSRLLGRILETVRRLLLEELPAQLIVSREDSESRRLDAQPLSA
jgi:RNA polymerase sigma-B factor